MPVWDERVRFRSHPPDPRYPGFATLETRVPPSVPSSSQPVSGPYQPIMGPFHPSINYKQQPRFYGQTVPYEVERAGASEEYRRYTFDRSRGIDSKDSESALVSKLSSSRWYMFTQPIWDGKTFTEVKQEEPAVYFKKTEKGFFELEYSPKRWKEEQHKRALKDLDFGFLAGEFFADVFNINRGDFAYRSLVESPMYGQPGYKPFEESQQELVAGGVYDYAKKWSKGEYGEIGVNVIKSPVGSTFLAYGLGKALGLLSQSNIGMKPFTTKIPFVTPSTVIGGGIGTYMGASIGTSLQSVHAKDGISGVRYEAGKLLFMSPVYAMAGKIGYESGIISAPKYQRIGQRIGETFWKGYQQYTPSSIQQTFSSAKSRVTQYDPFYFSRQTSKITQNLMPKNIYDFYTKARFSLREYPDKMAFQKSRDVWMEGLRYYGKDLYPIAMKHKAPFAQVDPGLYNYFEVHKHYPGYSVANPWKWPERDIHIMPRRINTETFINIPESKTSGTFVSVSKDGSFISTGDISFLTKKAEISYKQIFTGKKGGRVYDPLQSGDVGEQFAFVRGSTKYKVYDEHPIIPNIRTKPFSGIIRANELVIEKLSSDISGVSSTGSFKTVYGKDSFVGFSGRLFGEEYLSEGTSFSKMLSGSIGVPGVYGFKSIDIPDMGYAISTGKITGRTFAYYTDTALTFFEKIKSKSYYGETGGFDLSGLKILPPKTDIVMPGGIGVQSNKILFPSTNVFGTLSRSSGKTSFVDVGNVGSSYWVGIAPSLNMTQVVKPDVKTSLRLRYDMKEDIKWDVRSIVGSMESSINMQRQLSKQKQNQKQLQKQLTKQIYAFNVMSAQIIIPTVIMRIPTISTPLITPPSSPPPFIISPPPPPVTGSDITGYEYFLKKKKKLFGPSRWRIHPVEIDKRLLEVALF